MRLDSSIRKIAVLRALYLGDLLVAVPAFRGLRAGFPDAEISLISLPWAEELAGHLSEYIDRFVPFGGYPGLNDGSFEPTRSVSFISEQRAYGYDLVIQMHGSGGRSNPCARALGGRMTAGYYLGSKPAYLSPAALYPEHLPEVRRCLELAIMLGCSDLGSQLELPLLPDDRREAECLLQPLQGHRPLIGIHPGSKSPIRRWPAERFSAVADTLMRRYGAGIVITGGFGEEAAATVAAGIKAGSTLNLAGRTSFGGLAAVIASLDVLIVNNTGPAHLAEAVGTPTVRIYDTADIGRWEPIDPSLHRVLRGTPLSHALPDGRRWTWPPPAEVTAAVEQLLEVGVAA